MKRRATAMLLAFAMVVTAVPTTAFVSAEELEVVETITSDDAAAEVVAPAEVVAEPEAPVEDAAVEDAVIVEDAVVVEPEAPAAVAEDDLDIVEEVVEDGAAGEIAADVPIDQKKLADMTITVTSTVDKTKKSILSVDENGSDTSEGGQLIPEESKGDIWFTETYKKGIENKGGICPTVEITCNGVQLTAGTGSDNAYTVTYENNTFASPVDDNGVLEKMGLIHVVWNRQNPNFTDKTKLPDLTLDFIIEPGDLNSSSDLTLSVNREPYNKDKHYPANYVPTLKYTYDGQPHIPELTITDKESGIELVEGTDYQVVVWRETTDPTHPDGPTYQQDEVVSLDKVTEPGTYYMFANADDVSSQNYRGSYVASQDAFVVWEIEKAEFNETNIYVPENIVLYTDDFTNGQITVNAAWQEIRRRVYDKLANRLWEETSNGEYNTEIYNANQDTGKAEGDKLLSGVTLEPKNGERQLKYAFVVELKGTSKYFKKGLQMSDEIWGTLQVVNGTAPLNSVIENRDDAIKEALAGIAVYKNEELKTDIAKAIKEVIEKYPGMNNVDVVPPSGNVINAGNYVFTIKTAEASVWKGAKYGYTVTVEPRQMASSASAEKYPSFAKGFKGTAEQYVHMDGSYGKVGVTITDTVDPKPLIEGEDYTLRYVKGEDNEWVYITGKGNYKTTRGSEDVEVKLIVDHKGRINLADTEVVRCVIFGGETKTYGNGSATGAYEGAYPVTKDDIEVYEELNGEKYPIPSDYWTVVANDCNSNNLHRKQGSHWVEIDGDDTRGYVNTVKGYFNISGTDVNDHFVSELTKDTYDLTDTQVLWKNLGITVTEKVQHIVVKDWWDSFDVKITYSGWYEPTAQEIKDNLTTKDANGNDVVHPYTGVDEAWYYGGPSKNKNGLTFKHAGTYTVELVPNGNYPITEGFTGTINVGTITVRPRAFKEWSKETSGNRIKVSDAKTIEWTGHTIDEEDFARVIKVLDARRHDEPLKANRDYTVVKKSGGTKAGDDAVFTLEGINDYMGLFDVTIKVVPFDLTKVKDSWIEITNQPYWGGKSATLPVASIKEALKVYMEDPKAAEAAGRTALRMPAGDYEIECVDATNSGKWDVGDRVRVTIKPADNGNYAGTWEKVKVFNIVQANIANKTLFEVTGVPAVKAGTALTSEDAAGIGLMDTRNGYTLVLKSTPTANGEYTKELKKKDDVVLLNGAGTNYTGERTVTAKYTLEGGAVTAADQIYDGTEKKPALTVTDALGNVVPAEDYVAEYSNNVNAGTANVTVTVKESSENYAGTLSGTFTIAPAANSSLTVSPTEITVAPDEKKALTVTRDPSLPESVKTVFTSADPTVAIVDKDGNVTGVKAGSTKITVATGGTNYEKREATVNVTVIVMQATTITAESRRVVWTGAAQTIDLGAKASSGAALTYTVTTDNAKGGISIVGGKAAVTGDFIGEALVTISAPAQGTFKAATKTISVKVSPEDIRVTKATSKNGKIVVKYSTTDSATKYQLQIADNASFKNARTIKSKMWGDPNKRTIKTKIKKGNTYYVRVRACNRAGKVLFHSVNWSKAVAVKVR